ncbi:hypothetical protein ACWERI_18455 [Streptomyces collinus]
MQSFPDDLVQAQQEWGATYRRLAERPGHTELRRRLYRLSAHLYFHPHWQQRRPSPAPWRPPRGPEGPDGHASERLHP